MEYAQLMPGKHFAPVRGVLYYLQRLCTPRPLRKLACRAISAVLAGSHGKVDHASLARSHYPALALLREDGYAPLGHLLSTSQCADIHAFLRNRPLHDRDQPRRFANLAAVDDTLRLADYALRDLVCCPHILELANSPRLLALASDYLGCKPTISGLGMRWSFARAGAASALQQFHRDAEDWKYFKVLVYLTDVGVDDGPHLYVRKSHLQPAQMFLRYIDDEEISAGPAAANLVAATGGEGWGFAVDTAGIHKGRTPLTRQRLLLQIQYSLLPCYAYTYQPIGHPAYHDFDPYINRLILRQRRKRLRHGLRGTGFFWPES